MIGRFSAMGYVYALDPSSWLFELHGFQSSCCHVAYVVSDTDAPSTCIMREDLGNAVPFLATCGLRHA